MWRTISGLALSMAVAFAQPGLAQEQAQERLGAAQPTSAGRGQTKALVFAGGRIAQATGFGNTFLVTTPAGNVVIDTSGARNAPRHRALLSAVSDAPVRAIILTHAHRDHTGGVPTWKGPDTRLIAQAKHMELRAYQRRLARFMAIRAAQQYNNTSRDVDDTSRRGEEPTPDVLFDKQHSFKLGDLTFDVVAAPGETPDHLFVWVPELKAAFIGDNYYTSFPNIYTLRGTEPRPALDYVNSLNKILALKPEIVLPSHGTPIVGWPKIEAALTKYRDAILHVHDATVAGMNEGKDVYTLMREIKLPPALDVGEGYGAISWSVRGIYEGYAGWFDGDPASMYAISPGEAQAELGRLAGGAAPIASRAESLVATQPALALRLTSAALAIEPKNRAALLARRHALEKLLATSANSNESGWLNSAVAKVDAALE